MGGSESAMAAVLRDDDLLREILLRLGSPAFLVRAALVSKRWLGLAADAAFLRGFRDRHPPQLIGLYVREASYPYPQFVPVSKAPELHAAVRRAGFDRGDFSIGPFYCRNGRLLLQPRHHIRGQYVVRSLMCPMRSVVTVSPPLPLQLPDEPEWLRALFIRRDCFLSRDSIDGIVFLYMLLLDGKLSVHVYVMGSGVWSQGVLAEGQLPAQLTSVWAEMVSHGKLYMKTDNAYIHGLDFGSLPPQFFTIKLPDEVSGRNYRFSSGDYDGLLLIHGEGLQLSVWRHETDDNGEDSWELVDRFRVRMAHDCRDKIVVVGVGDNAELVFLLLRASGTIICVNLRSRKEFIVHKIPKGKLMSNITVFPFMMVWPPVFPALNDKDDHSA